MFIIDDLLLAPVKGLMFIAGRIKEAVDQELTDPQVIKRELLQVEMQQELGQISEEEAAQRKADLFARLRSTREPSAQPVHTGNSTSAEVEAVGVDGSEYGRRKQADHT